MNPDTEQVFGTLQTLLDPPLTFYLPYHEDGGSWVPYVWLADRNGEFNPLNFCRDRGWLHLTDADRVINAWQEADRSRLTMYHSHVSKAILAERNSTIAGWLQPLTSQLRALEAYVVSPGFTGFQDYNSPDFSPSLMLGETPDGDWIGVGLSVYKPTEIPQTMLFRSPRPASEPISLAARTIALQNQIQTMLEDVAAVDLYAELGGGYYYNHCHQFVQAAAPTQTLALEQLLQAVRVLEIHTFNHLSWDEELRASCSDTDELRDERLNQFLQQSLSQLTVVRYSFFTEENIYVVGRTQSEDWVGIHLQSEYIYNP